MSIALSEFWTRLVRSGITDAAGCKKLAASFSQANGGTPPSDAVKLAKFLVRAGAISEFQARALIAEDPPELRVGDFLLQSDQAAAPLSKWCQAIRAADGQPGVLQRVPAAELGDVRAQWLAAHAEIDADSLQSLSLASVAEDILVFSDLPAGKSLSKSIAGKALSAAKTCQVGISLAEALVALHSRPLLHGAVRLDHVWISKKGQATLLRNPIGPPTIPNAVADDSWVDQEDQPWLYAAPEFSDPNQACNQSTDIYSLGCLLYRLVVGEFPYQGEDWKTAITAHAEETPAKLAEAVAQGEAGDPLFRVLAFALAKSPSARFADASQLVGALRATLPLLSDKTSKADLAAASKANQTTEKQASEKSVPLEKPTAEEREQPTERKNQRAGKEGQATASKKSSSGSSKTASPKPERPKQPKGESNTEPKPEQPKPVQADPKPKPDQSGTKVRPQTKPAQRSSEQNETATTPAETRTKKVAEAAASPTPAPIETAVDGPKPAESEVPVNVNPPQDSPDQVAAAFPDEPAEPRASRRRRKKKASKAPLILGGLCVAVLMLIVGLLVYEPSDDEPEKTTKRPRIPAVIPPVVGSSNTGSSTDTVPSQKEPATASGYELVSDERLLFVPPYGMEANAASLELLPPGPAAIISARLADLAASPLAENLGPELDGLFQEVSRRAAVPIESIDHCSVALHPGTNGWPEVSLAVQLKEPEAVSTLTEKWKVSASRTREGFTIYAGDEPDTDAYFFMKTDADAISRFAVGSIARISEVAADEGAAILLPRVMQTLWDETSEEADLSVLVTPNFLFADGRELLKSTVPDLVAPLKVMLVPDTAGVLFVADQVGDSVYLETRMAPSGGVSEAAMMRTLQGSVQAWPEWAEEFIVSSVPDPSWRLLASRMPTMMRFVEEQTRFGVSQDAAVANTYLPIQAVPQVAVATMLAMNTTSSGPQIVTSSASKSLTIDEMLDLKMSVEFDQESMQFAIDAIVAGFTEVLPAGSKLPPILIVGGDLQLEGITQNQQVRNFSKMNLPLRTVLTDLMLGANPDKTATGPADPKQKLIWVVAEDPANKGVPAILVTTRQSAAGKYELPAEFVAE